ncbi:MAG: PQQ-binding-like beta-propeller repeat protein [Candidatus Eisenbacteria bacterium]|uniref:PQQ-binding-like beta-propeller repeat protein n=1 Tax=Eiseniibacteriota bacterium TaxID=2212470 RepID=A0A7Y2EAY2_UNCEI|nr:PQQ-binding-like beta-propeller repeat protein [Candidatus Eisenbacteria bacterium]
MSPSNALSLAWSQSRDHASLGPPRVVADHVLTLSDPGTLQATQLTTGEVVWTREVISVDSKARLGVQGELVYFTDADGTLRSFNAETGEEQEPVSLGTLSSEVRFYGSLVISVSQQGCIQAQDRWRQRTRYELCEFPQPEIYLPGSMARVGSRGVAEFERGLFSWRLLDGELDQVLPMDSGLTTGIAKSRGCAFFGTANGDLVKVYIDPLRVEAAVNTSGGIKHVPLVSRGHVVVLLGPEAHSQEIVSYDFRLQELWRQPPPPKGQWTSTLASMGSALYAGDSEGAVHALELTSGDHRASLFLEKDEITHVVMAGNFLLATTRQGGLYCLNQ